MFIIGKKKRMTQIWKDENVVPVTLVYAKPNEVSMVRTKDRDGYEAVQLKLGRTRREFRTDKVNSRNREESVSLNAGDKVDISSFNEGDFVNVRGVMKGRGFQGVVKRHNFAGGPKTHGQKNRLRAPGSIGSTAPQRVWPGRKMAGHMGTTTVTVKNLKVVAVDPEKNTLALRGAIPGNPGSVLEIRIHRRAKPKEDQA